MHIAGLELGVSGQNPEQSLAPLCLGPTRPSDRLPPLLGFSTLWALEAEKSLCFVSPPSVPAQADISCLSCVLAFSHHPLCSLA